MHHVAINAARFLNVSSTRGSAGFDCQFQNADGRPLLAVFDRSGEHPGEHRVVVSAMRPDGIWTSETSAALMPGEEHQPLSILFTDWHLDIRLPERVLLQLNPSSQYGDDVRPENVYRLALRPPVSGVTVSTGDEFARMRAALPASEDDASSPSELALHIVGAMPEMRQPWLDYRVGSLQHWDLSAPNASAELATALQAPNTDTLALFSGDWEREQIEMAIDAYQSCPRSAQIMALNWADEFHFDDYWALILPATFRQRPALWMHQNQVFISPDLVAYGYWTRPPFWGHPERLADLRRHYARVPGRSGSLPAPPPQNLIIVPSAKPLSVPPLPTSHQEVLRLCEKDHASITLSQLLLRIGQELDRSATEQVVIHLEGLGPADLTCLLQSAPLTGCVLLRKGKQAQAILLTARALHRIARFLRSNRDSEQIELTQASEMIQAVQNLCTAAEITITPVDGPNPTNPHSQRDSKAFWLRTEAETKATLHGELTRALVTHCAANWADFVHSGLYYGFHWELVRRAAVLEADAIIDAPIAVLVDAASELASALGDGALFGLAEQLAGLGYVAEALRLAARAAHTEDPQLELRRRAIEIAAARDDLRNDAYIDEPRCIDPRIEPWCRAAHLNAVFDYLGVREEFARIRELYEEAPLDPAPPGRLMEKYLIARLRTGSTDGLAPLIDQAHQAGHLPDWARNRLAMWVQHAAGNRTALRGEIQTLLETEADMAPLLRAPTVFTALSPTIPILGENEVAGVIVARNEFVRLKWLLQYYRELGVSRFILIDNGSTDETLDHFAGCSDITVMQTHENYRDSRYGVKWHNEIADRYLSGRWVLTVDADEMLVYPDVEQVGLPELCQRLDQHGREGLFTTMIDMYADRSLDDIDLQPGDSLIELFSHFDGTGYRHTPMPGLPRNAISGGVRIRAFWNNWRTPDMPGLAQQKVPLVKWRPGFRYLGSTHDLTPVTLAETTGALLHFKFMPDFHQRALEEVRRNQHFDGAREYRLYAKMLEKPENRCFLYAGSEKYVGSHQLEALRLMFRGCELSPLSRPATNGQSFQWMESSASKIPTSPLSSSAR